VCVEMNQLTTLLIIFACITLVVCEEFKITTLHMPEECTARSRAGDTLKVHYTGRLQDGKIFDSSIETGRDPIEFELGSGRVIPGWERGLMDMCVGEKRKVVIPPELAYGKQGAGPIPADSTLYFETELVGITPGQAPPTQDTEQGAQKSGWINTRGLGLLGIVAGFAGLIYFLLKTKPEFGRDQVGPKTSKKRR